MMLQTHNRHQTSLGLFWGLIAVLIWAGWLVLTSTGQVTDLAVIDLAGFRALIPMLVLAPLLWRERAVLGQIGLLRCLLLACYGLPFTLSVGYGLTFAPVSHAGALVPGTMPLLAAALGLVFLRERVRGKRLIGLALILLSTLFFTLHGGTLAGSGETRIGHALFLLGSLCWAIFTVTLKPLGISPYLATAIVGGISTILVLPVWALSDLSNLSHARADDILFQMIFQGVLSGLVSLYAFGQAIRLLGSAVGAFSALTPGIAALMAIPILGQIPVSTEFFVLGLMVAGVYLASRTQSST